LPVIQILRGIDDLSTFGLDAGLEFGNRINVTAVLKICDIVFIPNVSLVNVCNGGIE
jgi:hypothetical protein